ncbi:MAG: lycopene cyclase domain-containing protein [Patescibacteria group bacterium]
MSCLFLFAGTIGEIFYFQDYWNPGSILSINIGPVGILLEDLLFSFSVAGIGAVIYRVFFDKRVLLEEKKFFNAIPAFLGLSFISLAVSCLLFFIGVNSIFATSIGFITGALYIIVRKRGFLVNSLLSGLFMSLIVFVSYVILRGVILNSEQLLQQGWLLYNTTLDLRIFDIPFTEIIWFFAFGMLLGPSYEFIKGLKAN